MSETPANACLAIFDQERARLISTLGDITSGGVVEGVHLFGSSSLPGLCGSGSIDIGLSVWPFPVDVSLLAKLGYQPVSSFDAKVQRFANSSGQVQVWLVSAESSFLEHALLIRDYLLNVEEARQEFAVSPPRTLAEKAAYFARILPDAQRWWIAQKGFAPLETIAAEFIGGEASQPASFPWYVSSGWAIDLFLERVTRVHRDVDVVIPFHHQMAAQEHLTKRGWKLLTPLDGRLEQWPRHMRIELPRHQVHAHRDGSFIDLLLTEIEHGVWRYRRNPVILRNAELIGLKSANGIPYLAPELVLLFKSKNTGTVERSQDQIDFEQALPLLEAERRTWLRWAITASDPEHPWLAML